MVCNGIGLRELKFGTETGKGIPMRPNGVILTGFEVFRSE